MNLKSIAALSVATLAAHRFTSVHAAPVKISNTHARAAARDAIDVIVTGDGVALEGPSTAPLSAAPVPALPAPPPRQAPTLTATQFVTVTVPSAPAATSIFSAPQPVGASQELAPVGAPSAGPNEPTITLRNKSSQTRYYFIEASAGNDPLNLNGRVVSVPPGGTLVVNPGVGFNGAITDNGSKAAAACLGTRMEFNAAAGGVYYDADTQYGNTDATFGPDDGSGILEGNGDLQHYILAGAVAGKTESAADLYSDKSTQHVMSTKFTLTSLDYTPGPDGGNTYTAALDPNKVYNVAYASGNGEATVDN